MASRPCRTIRCNTRNGENHKGSSLFSFLPTNRARLLNRAIEICARQTFRDFEVVVIDDGSMDDTAWVLREWGERADFRLRWQRQESSGKPRTYNAALEQARGYFLVVLDSDDCLVADALEIFKRHWESIPDNRRLTFAGVEGLMRDLRTGTLESDSLLLGPWSTRISWRWSMVIASVGSGGTPSG